MKRISFIWFLNLERNYIIVKCAVFVFLAGLFYFLIILRLAFDPFLSFEVWYLLFFFRIILVLSVCFKTEYCFVGCFIYSSEMGQSVMEQAL